MAIWTVFESEEAEAASSLAGWAEGVAFVPERFGWSALAFAPLVLLAHRLWLAFLVYALVQGALAGAVLWFEFDTDAFVLLVLTNVAVALLLPGLRRGKLVALGHEEVGAVAAPSLEAAEQRYIEARLGGASLRAPASAPSSVAAGHLARASLNERPVLGLFPEASR